MSKKWQILRKVLVKIPFFPLYIYHYALLSPIKMSDGARVIINYGPINWFFRPQARITFDFYGSKKSKKIWEPAKGLYWEKELDDDTIIEGRIPGIISHIKEKRYHDHLWGNSIPPIHRSEKYDLDENNCEHFCANIVYGTRFSSQIDVFAD